jgi:glycerol-3-phosphate dehydrogenase
LRIHGWFEGEVGDDRLGEYGSDAEAIRGLETSEPGLDTPLAPGVAVTGAQVIWAVRSEMARTVEDVLSRRTRALLLGARASIGAAPAVASLMARELGRDDRWQREVVASYRALALRYVL